MESIPCDAQNNAGSLGASSLSLVYTDSGTTGLDSSDTIDTASSDSSIDFNSGGTEYFYSENGFIYSVSFTTITTLTFNPTLTTCTTDTGTDTGTETGTETGSSTTIYLESTACEAETNLGSLLAVSIVSVLSRPVAAVDESV